MSAWQLNNTTVTPAEVTIIYFLILISTTVRRCVYWFLVRLVTRYYTFFLNLGKGKTHKKPHVFADMGLAVWRLLVT
jgi:hypothetical protein